MPYQSPAPIEERGSLSFREVLAITQLYG